MSSSTNVIRQQPGFDTTSIISLVWFLIIVVGFYWFYTTIRRMERTLKEILEEIKKKAG